VPYPRTATTRGWTEDRPFLPSLVEDEGTPGELAHGCVPHLLPEKAEQLLQVSAPVAGTGTDNAANHPGERTYDSSLAEAMLRRVFRS
jgi:hypothetical protein